MRPLANGREDIRSGAESTRVALQTAMQLEASGLSTLSFMISRLAASSWLT